LVTAGYSRIVCRGPAESGRTAELNPAHVILTPGDTPEWPDLAASRSDAVVDHYADIGNTAKQPDYLAMHRYLAH